MSLPGPGPGAVPDPVSDSTFFHVAFLVRDLDEAIPRMEGALGVVFLEPKAFVLDSLVDEAHFGDADPHPFEGRAVYSVQGPPYFELVEAKGHGVFSLDGREEGFHHVGMFVDDSHGTCEEMALKGVVARARILGSDGRTRVWFSEPSTLHGVSLELLDSTSQVLKNLLAAIAAHKSGSERNA